MKAAQLMAPRHMQIVDLPDPVRKPGQITVKMLRVSICGSDLHKYRGRPPCEPFPMAPGKPAHECLGRILDCDQGSGFVPGEMVLVRPSSADGLRELLVVRDVDLHPVRSHRLEPDLALMAQLVAPVIHCCNRLGKVKGKSVFIIGQGPAGLTLTSMMRRMGAALVVTSDLVESRLKESARRGADRAIVAGPGLLSEAKSLTNGRMFDIVVEAVGEDDTIILAPQLAREEGLVVFFGLPGATAQLRPVEFFSKQLWLTTSEFPEAKDFARALQMIAQGEIDIATMITHRLPFWLAPKGYELADRRDEVLRVVLTFED